MKIIFFSQFFFAKKLVSEKKIFFSSIYEQSGNNKLLLILHSPCGLFPMNLIRSLNNTNCTLNFEIALKKISFIYINTRYTIPEEFNLYCGILKKIALCLSYIITPFKQNTQFYETLN